MSSPCRPRTAACLCTLLFAALFGSRPARAGRPAPEPTTYVIEEPAVESVIEDDVKPTLILYQQNGVELAIGGLMQLHLAPFVGDDALLDDDDPAAREGFRLRRARLGVEASLPNCLGFLLVLDPLESEPGAGAVSEARVSWSPATWLRISAGADKVPFSHGELQSSAELATIERPLTVQTLVPQRRLGALVEGSALGGLSWAAGVMNATEGYERGNQFSGLLYVGRLQYALTSGALEVAVGLGGYFENGPATNVKAGSADLRVAAVGASLLVEAICDQTTPDDSPTTSPEVADALDRCGGYTEVGYQLPSSELQPLVRLEWLDDNTGLDDAGDAWLLSVGANFRVNPHLRAQLHYLGRYERESAERANDSVILGVQGEL